MPGLKSSSAEARLKTRSRDFSFKQGFPQRRLRWKKEKAGSNCGNKRVRPRCRLIASTEKKKKKKRAEKELTEKKQKVCAETKRN
jgi:hypothetical protein